MPAASAVERVRLGDRGPVVSRLAVGTSPFGGVFGRYDPQTGVDAVRAALEAGVNPVTLAGAQGAGEVRRNLSWVMESPALDLVGSDWPVCTLAAHYEEAMGLVVDVANTLSDAERTAVLEGSARSWYRLPMAGGECT